MVKWNELGSSAYAPATRSRTFPELQVLISDSTGPVERGCESISASGDLAALL